MTKQIDWFHNNLNRDDRLLTFLEGTDACAIGLFNLNGAPISLNRGMKLLLAVDEGSAEPIDYFTQPTFSDLVSSVGTGSIHKGLFTFGGPGVPHRSLLGEVWRQEDQLWIVCSYDVTELEQTNRQITGLNSEITNLQRQVSFEKMKLARTNRELEQTLRELQEAQAQLIQEQKMSGLGQVSAGIAHEINNPTAFVTSNVKSLKIYMSDLMEAFLAAEEMLEETEDEALIEELADIKKAIDFNFMQEDTPSLFASSLDGLERIRQIVKSMQSYIRHEEEEYKQVNFLENIESTLLLARSELKTGIEVVLDGVEQLPNIIGSPQQLNQLFMNLIMNACQAMEGSGRLLIQGINEVGFITLKFADNGPGISPEILNKIFDPFFTTKAVGKGTGLGLYISYRIVTEMHDGALSVDSTVGEGTTFTIRIPKNLHIDGDLSQESIDNQVAEGEKPNE